MPKMNLMPATEFDDLLRDKYEQGRFEYKPAAWDRLSAQLPQKKKSLLRRRIFWLPLAAAAALAGFITVPLLRNDHKGNITHVQQSANREVNPAQKLPAVDPIVATAPIVAALPPTVIPLAKKAAISTSSSYHPTIAAPIAKKLLSPTLVDPAQEIAPPPVQPENVAPQNKVAIIAPGATLPQIIKNGGNATVATAPRLPGSRIFVDGVMLKNESPVFEDANGKKFRSTLLSVAGGYKYGTANMGYMVGINGRRSLGEKVFVEGDLAFANSRNAQVTTETSNTNFDQVKTVAGKNTVGARALSRGEVIGNMYYLQVTPTVGYQVFRTMAVGAGADVQRMFRNEENTLYIMDGSEVKAIPQMDYGVVGKAEYSLTKTFKAGLQYRQGMNGVVAPDKNYLNRSYIQVQLKLGILGH